MNIKIYHSSKREHASIACQGKNLIQSLVRYIREDDDNDDDDISITVVPASWKQVDRARGLSKSANVIEDA